MVFGLLVIVLGAVTFAAVAVYQGTAAGPFTASFVTPAGDFNSDTRLVCPPTNATALPNDQVVVRVLNGTKTEGLAGRVRTTLDGRSFLIVAIGNATYKYPETARIIFGEDGVHQAWSLASHFEDVELILDTREGAVVDLVLGEQFVLEDHIRPLLAPELQPDTLLAANAPCLPANLVVAEPAPRIIPANPLAPTASPSPEPEPAVVDPDATD